MSVKPKLIWLGKKLMSSVRSENHLTHLTDISALA